MKIGFWPSKTRKASEITSEQFPLDRMPRAANTLVLTAKGAGVNPAYEAVPAGVVAASGSYGGDEQANKAVAHGLGVTPKLVIIISSNSNYWFRMFGSLLGTLFYMVVSTDAKGTYALTNMDATNFYVGNAGDWSNSANNSAYTYYWFAIG